MAFIEKRKTDDGVTHYRVKIRLKDYPPVTKTLPRHDEAKRWARETETAIRDGLYFKTIEAKKHTLADLVDRARCARRDRLVFLGKE